MRPGFIFLLSIYVSSILQAQTSHKAPAKPAPKTPTLLERIQTDEKKQEINERQEEIEEIKGTPPLEQKPELVTSTTKREESHFSVQGLFSPYDLLIPGKLGASVTYNHGGKSAWELEFMRGSFGLPRMIVDLGGVSEYKLSLMRRSFLANSFNVSYGVTYGDVSAKLSNKYLSATTQTPPEIDLLQWRTAGLNFAIGNRWVLSEYNFVLGIDWVGFHQPLFMLEKKSIYEKYTTNSNYKDDVKDAERLISYFPRLYVLKFQLGMQF